MQVKILIITLSFCICVVSCTKTPPPKLELSLNSITVDSNGASSTVEVKSNVAWKVTATIPDWLVIHPELGQGDAHIQISGIPNTKYPRTWDILIVCTEQTNLSAILRVSQPVVGFNINETSLFFEDDGTTLSITLHTEAEWSITSHPDWSTIFPNSGKGNAVIQISASANEHKKDRSGDISFSYYDTQLSLYLIQKGNALFNKPPDKPELIFPLDHSIDISTYPHFAWICSDPDDDPLTYTIYISQDGINYMEYGPYTNTQVYLDNELDAYSLYYYKIKADDGDQGITYSDTYSFTTRDRTVYADGEVILYMQSTKPKPVVLVFTGDGYIKQDCNVGGLFEQNATEGIEALFGTEPYKAYRDYFSVYVVFAHSLESGATQIDKGIYRQTAFGSRFENEGTHMSTNTDKVFEYARKVPEMAEYGLDNTCVFVMVNQDRYAGTCWMWSGGRSVAICPVSRRGGNYDYANIVLHEGGGHGFGRLADEYINNNAQIPMSEVNRYRANQERGMFLNVDFISDPQNILWSGFLGISGYNRVGVYEGAALYRYGAWRSEETNCMINNMKYYNVASREQIVKRILTISGDGYTREKFIDMDYVKTPDATTEMETKSFDPKTFIPLAPPVVVR